MGYDLKSLSLAEYIRDSRFWILGLAYRFLDDERTHWLAGNHAIEAWVKSIDWSDIIIINHNSKFDGSILAWHYNIKPHSYIDTVALAKAVLGENVSGYSLKSLAQYLGLPAKGEMNCEGVMTPTPQQMEELATYCKNDVDLCKGIYDKLIGQFPVGQLSVMDWTIRCFIEPKLVLDAEVLKKGVENEKQRREKAIATSGIEKAILSSNKKFAEYLSARNIAVPTKKSVRTGKDIPAFAKTDAGLEEIRQTHPQIYEARIAAKANLLETRGEALLAVGKTGLFPFDVGFSGAVQTHRFSGGSGAGGNPQNFTRNSFLREAVCAPEGYKLVVGDFAAIELRLLAWLAKEPKLMGKIINDEDIYADFASLKYGRTITKADKSERQFGKCLAEGTRVLTQAGWKNIETVGMNDKLWDGEAWVTHQGLQYKGEKEVIGLNGLYLTPDHRVLCGTEWKESQFLARDENSLCQALETGSGKLPSQAISEEFGGALSGFCGNALAEGRKLLLKLPTYEAEEPRDATSVLKSRHNRQENYIGAMLPTWSTMSTVCAFLIAYRQLLLGAITQKINTTSIMVLAESPSAKSGGEIAALSYPMFRLSLTGMFNRLKWIEQTLMETTSRVTLDLYLGLQISVISEGLKTWKPKLPVFDLLSAGPQNRFTVLTAEGPLIVHNCSILGLGYNMGAKKFKLTVKNQMGIDISEEEAWRTVNLYRTTYFNVPKLWEQAHAVIPLISTGTVGCLWFAPFIKVKKGALVLPSGLTLKYPNLRQVGDDWVYDVYKKTYEAEPTNLYGGKLVENLCQALAGELTKEAIARAERMGLPCVAQIHDEIIGLALDRCGDQLDDLVLKSAMERAPNWLPTLKLKAEVRIGGNWNEAKA